MKEAHESLDNPLVREIPAAVRKPRSSSSKRQRKRPILNIQKGHLLLAHLWICLIYLSPILNIPQLEFHSGLAVLDEHHIVSNDNKDVNGVTTTRTIFTNDYWGRPMNLTDSHKSWRPLSILSFRYLKLEENSLTIHRIVNVVLHAAVAECVGILAVRLAGNLDPNLVGLLAKLWFGLHPTHVEVTANAANRPHLLALLCSLVASDPLVHWTVMLASLTCGYLSCETFLFQTIPIMVLIMAIQYIQRRKDKKKKLVDTLKGALPRLAMVVLSGLIYYGGRHYMQWLDIPEGLIRPAENPFFTLTGMHRVRNYLYVIAIHITKVWGMDIIGFAHEYGFDCITEIHAWSDVRLLWPVGIVAAYLLSLTVLLLIQRKKKRIVPGLIWWIIHVSFLVTLFPVSGFVKVGTFVSDRIVVAASVSSSLLLAHMMCRWITWRNNSSQYRRLGATMLLFGLMSVRVYRRTSDWMDSYSLLTSSLETCPRFAKGHLELSKIYSSLYPEMKNLTKAHYHISAAEEIDPDFCDVHYQYAQVAIQQGKALTFEQSLSKALLCPFSASGAQAQWEQYWQMTLQQNDGQSQATITQTYERYKKYMTEINEKIDELQSTQGK